MQKILTDVLVRAIAAPASGRVEVGDTRCAGLTIRVTAGGAKSWSYRFRDPRSAAVTRATIGPYPEISLATARDRASDMRKAVANGVNPVEAKRQEREAATTKTFGALADRYLEEHAKRFKRSAAADERNLRLHVRPAWEGRRYDEIRRSDVIALCEGMVQAGTATNANRVQALVSKVFSFAVDADLVPSNPCLRLAKRGAEVRGRRVLSDVELRIFWTGIVEKPITRSVGLALRIAALTACRVSEVAEAELAEFANLDDPERAGWTIPAERSKNGRAHFVPLSALAREAVLEARELPRQAEEKRRSRGKVADDETPIAFAHLFPSPTNRLAPITGHALSVAMIRFGKALAERGASESWTAEPPSPHDLRRTVATRLAGLGTPGEDVAAVLNHARRDVTGIHYDQYDRAREKRIALAAWSAEVARVCGADL